MSQLLDGLNPIEITNEVLAPILQRRGIDHFA